MHRKYLHIIGITRREVHEIRKNLLVPHGDQMNPDMLSTFSMGSQELEGARSPESLQQPSMIREPQPPKDPRNAGRTCGGCCGHSRHSSLS